VNVNEIKAHVTENKLDDKKVVDPLDDEDEAIAHSEFSKENIVESFNAIRDCVQQYKDIQFEELKEHEKKKGKNNMSSNKRGKQGDDDDSNLH